MDVTFEWIRLRLADPFVIARDRTDELEYCVVRVTDEDGRIGIGGAAPSRRYGETPATVTAVLSEFKGVLPKQFLDSTRVELRDCLAHVEQEMNDVIRSHSAVHAAVSIALHDLASKKVDVPLYKFLDLDPTAARTTSYTIGIDSPRRMAAKARAAKTAGFDTLKIKLGTPEDRAIMTAIRDAVPTATLWIDANEAWSPVVAIDRLEMLSGFDVEFVEQPVPGDDLRGLRVVHDRSPIPIAADESCVTSTDIQCVSEFVDIVNIKLMKCGGFQHVIRLINTAHAHDLEVLLGCMVESNASIAAACHLTPLVEYVDLDGALLLADDPFTGVPIESGEIKLLNSHRQGTGARTTSD